MSFPTCNHCDEPVLKGEQADIANNAPFHHECAFRLIAGSVAHIERRCSCFNPRSEENDPPGMTRREAARAAVEAYKLRDRNGKDLQPPCIQFRYKA